MKAKTIQVLYGVNLLRERIYPNQAPSQIDKIVELNNGGIQT